MVGRKCCECLSCGRVGGGRKERRQHEKWERAGKDTGAEKGGGKATKYAGALSPLYSTIPSLGLNRPSRAGYRGRSPSSGLRSDSIWATDLVIVYIARNWSLTRGVGVGRGRSLSTSSLLSFISQKLGPHKKKRCLKAPRSERGTD